TLLRRQGRAAVISGAGPSVLVLGRRDELGDLAGSAPAGFRFLTLGVGGPADVVTA
ncbi:MAG: hypothetical protein JWP61_2943, partial [Friedmanniella sp.]|nr:hypothetical protein [Friedmanniella sp.]